MPFVYDETNLEWPKDGSDPPPPRPDQFEYFPPTDFGGEPEPVRFSVPLSAPTASAKPPPRRSLLHRLLGRRRPSEDPRRSPNSHGETEEERPGEIFAIMIPPLRELGVLHAYCRYDGGNDEGFAWLDRAMTRGGAPVDMDTLFERLLDLRIQTKLYDSGLMRRNPNVSDREVIKRAVCDALPSEWAVLLLNSGFGTGEYCMYGAFIVDLEACTIVDDPNADPVVEHIELGK